MQSKEEIESILNKCDNCNLSECINCEMSYEDRQKIKKYIDKLETEIAEHVYWESTPFAKIKDLYIAKDKIKQVVEKIKEYRDTAKEQIEEDIIVIDGNSINRGKKQAHEKDAQILEELLEGK